MRRYETIFIIRPGVGDDEATAIIDKATGTITEHQGSIVKLDKWGVRKLAYPIKKEQQGNYLFMEYAGVPEAVAEMERVFRIDDRILKYMTVKTQDVYVADPEVEAEEAATADETAETAAAE